MVRKMLVCILFLYCIATVFGCGVSNADAIEENVRTVDRNNIRNMQTDFNAKKPEEAALHNPYFFEEDRAALTARAVYDDGLLVSILDTDEKLIENNVIVCQEEDVSVDEEDGEGRYRYCISGEKGRITYDRSDVQLNGERGFYEWFIWKEGEGLIFLFPRTMRKIAMLAWKFDECREGQYLPLGCFNFYALLLAAGLLTHGYDRAKKFENRVLQVCFPVW